MTRQVVEPLKTLIIVLLLALALFLAGKTGVFNELISSVPVLARTEEWIRTIGRPQANEGTEIRSVLHEASRPVGIVLTDKDGAHVGVMYDEASLNELYNKVSKTLGEALGSASAPEEANRRQWEGALKSEGIYFEFSNEIPLTVITRWLGLDMINENSHSVKRICITGSRERADIYYISGDNRFFKCRTAAALGSAIPLTGAFSQINFAFEMGEDFKNIDPNTLIINKSPDLYKIKVENPLKIEAARASVITAFGINPGSNDTYIIDEGIVFVETDSTLEIYEDGSVFFDCTGDGKNKIGLPYAERANDTGDIIEAAWKMVAALLEHGGRGDEEMYFTGIEKDSTFEVTFDYFINGMEIINEEHGATVTIKDGRIINVRARIKSYRLTNEKAVILPAKVAAASTGQLFPGSPMYLVYEDSGTDLLTPFWSPRRQ